MASQQLGDILAGFGGHPVDRQGINQGIAQAQAMNGLRSAQTTNALMDARKAQDEMAVSQSKQAAAHQMSSYITNLFPGNPDLAEAMSNSFAAGGGNMEQLASSFDKLQDFVNQHTLGDPNASQAQKAAAAAALQKKNLLDVPANYMDPNNMAAGVQQTPGQAATTANTNAEAQLRTLQAAHPELFHAGAGATQLSQQDIDVYGDRLFETGQMPSLGMGASPLRAQILQSAAARATGARQPVAAAPGASGTAAGNFTANAGMASSGKQALGALQKQASLVQAYETTAGSNLDLANSYMQANAQKMDASGIPMVNKALLHFQNNVTGDPDTAQFVNALTTARDEYARVISGSTGAAGITDAARTEANQLFPAGLTAQQLPAAIATAKTEMQNRTKGLTDQIKSTRDNLANISAAAPTASVAPPASSGTASPPAANAPAAAAPGAGGAAPQFEEGQTATGPNGQKAMYKGGQWQVIPPQTAPAPVAAAPPAGVAPNG